MIKIQLKGLGELQATINRSLKQAEQGTHTALSKFAKNVETQAKRDAPANEGKLRNSIVGDVKGYTASVTVGADYAAYLEFGTRKFAARYVATLPQDWKTYAATFKGPGGGTMAEFIQDIMQWVQQKGIGALRTKSGNASKSAGSLEAMQQAAYAIALNILQNGIRPKPFIYPAVQVNTPILEADIKKAFGA